MEVRLAMDGDPPESIWVREKEQTSGGDVVDVCYELPGQEEQADEVSNREPDTTSHSFLTGDFKHPNTYWGDKTEGHKWLVLERTDDRTLMWKGANEERVLLNFILNNKEGFFGDDKTSHCEIVEFRIL